jgi:hypothetical protein
MLISACRREDQLEDKYRQQMKIYKDKIRELQSTITRVTGELQDKQTALSQSQPPQHYEKKSNKELNSFEMEKLYEILAEYEVEELEQQINFLSVEAEKR